MLPSAARRAIQNPTLLSNRSARYAAPGVNSISALRSRPFATGSKPPRPPPAPTPKTPSRTPPPPKSFPGGAAAARQTSPGTSVPPKAAAKPQQPPAASSSSANPPTGSAPVIPNSNASSPVDGARPAGDVAQRAQPLADHAQEQDPSAQRLNADKPPPQSLRDVAQERMAASENTPPPTEQPARPLPDLRQGIPSTFDFEFGAGKDAAKQQKTDEDGLDLASEDADSRSQQRERGERDYDQSAYETSLDRRRAQLANYLYLFVAVGVVGSASYFARPFADDAEVPTGLEPENASGWAPGKMYARLRARLGSKVGYYTEPTFPKLLPEVPEGQRPPFTLVMSLEDLLIHTSWDTKHGYRTAKRPGLDYFIRYLTQYYELVLFTSVPRAIADPVIAKMDPYHLIMWPLGREATKYEQGEFVKDLSYLNRPLNKTIIIDTHAPHVKNQPENAIILPKWNGDPKDEHTKDLVGLIPFLEYVATMGIEDVRPVLKSFEGAEIPVEFARREAEARKKFNEQLALDRARKPKISLGSFASSLGVKGGPGMGGGLVLADGQSVAEGFAQGKMLSDQIREQGQKQYELLEQQIREHGEQWLKDEAEEMKKLADAQMKDMKKGALSWWPGGSGKE